MIAPDPSKSDGQHATDGDSNRSAGLPFRVELWDEKARVEQVLARTHSATLAQAVFHAACEQYPGRHLSLSRDGERLAERG